VHFVKAPTCAIGAIPYNFCIHQKGEKCQTAYDLGVWDLTVLQPQRTECSVPEPVVPGSLDCPGIPLVWLHSDFFSTYPWHLHDSNSGLHLPWRICSFSKRSGEFYIRAETCNRVSSGAGSACGHCVAVANSVYSKYVSMNAKNADYANHIHWSRQQILEHLGTSRSRFLEQKMALTALHSRLDSATNRALEYQPILDLLSKYDIPRLPALLTQSIQEKEGVCALARRLEDAALGLYHSRSSYSRRNLDLALYVHCLGGHRLLYALHHEHGLPSRRTVMHKHAQASIRLSTSTPQPEEVVANIRDLVIKPRENRPRRRVGCTIPLDDIVIQPAVCYIPDLHSLGGVTVLKLAPYP
jgi:hypothetical protein